MSNNLSTRERYPQRHEQVLAGCAKCNARGVYAWLMDLDLVAVIVAHNSEHVVGELLDSIPAALGDVRAAVVVVDNDSTDGTVALVAARTDCYLLQAPNLGYSAGVNRGAAAVPDAPAILVLNPDVRLEPGAVAAMLKALDHPNTAVVAPRIVEPDGRLFRSLRREPTIGRATGLGFTGHPRLSEQVTDPRAYDHAHYVDWALGAVLLLDRKYFRQLGGWDESFFLYSEETDYCLRARDHGWLTRYEPSAIAMHIGGQSGQSDRIHAMQILNRVRLYRRRHGLVPSVLYYGLTILSELTWVLRGHKQSLASIRSLLRPDKRPLELGVSDHLLPA